MFSKSLILGRRKQARKVATVNPNQPSQRRARPADKQSNREADNRSEHTKEERSVDKIIKGGEEWVT
jgi:hypothetical protein